MVQYGPRYPTLTSIQGYLEVYTGIGVSVFETRAISGYTWASPGIWGPSGAEGH